jgi:hypothetical protein
MSLEDASRASHDAPVMGRKSAKAPHLRLAYSRDWEQPMLPRRDEARNLTPVLIFLAAMVGLSALPFWWMLAG